MRGTPRDSLLAGNNRNLLRRNRPAGSSSASPVHGRSFSYPEPRLSRKFAPAPQAFGPRAEKPHPSALRPPSRGRTRHQPAPRASRRFGLCAGVPVRPGAEVCPKVPLKGAGSGVGNAGGIFSFYGNPPPPLSRWENKKKEKFSLFLLRP